MRRVPAFTQAPPEAEPEARVQVQEVVWEGVPGNLSRALEMCRGGKGHSEGVSPSQRPPRTLGLTPLEGRGEPGRKCSWESSHQRVESWTCLHQACQSHGQRARPRILGSVSSLALGLLAQRRALGRAERAVEPEGVGAGGDRSAAPAISIQTPRWVRVWRMRGTGQGKAASEGRR